ncbi:hypothetical protein DQ239_11695 [Blastococcus sp. TF02-09]|uniref:hypothetical protein n=1 Tax=Blastococcus sp. TF02-09 TaxID=2250576 RepID=UPI000DE9CD4E|nr:hypothetical protein [Blastococcus sp. TF02-9]RBY77525.1 hypothetical protein DQ239_11695 [Blastococcus sp. TF02-9]
MSSLPSPAARGFSRRTLLAASAAGLAVVAVGCTSAPPDERERVTGAQADELLGQVGVQETLVAAYTAAGAADPGLAGEVADLAAQAGEQLERLRDAAPGATPSSPSPGTPPSPAEARAWLRDQVATAATSHATACVNQSGARAALLGSISAGLRGQDGRLA